LSDHRSKILHLHRAIHQNVGEAVAISLLKQVLHGLPGAHHDAWDRRSVSLEVSIDSTIIDSKNIGQLTEFERREALARSFPHPHKLLFKSFVRGINALGGESMHDGNAISLPGGE
jgi:hypothetical protein